MLWYKGWLETRVQVLLAIGFYAMLFAGLSVIRLPASSPLAAMKAPEQVRTIVRLGFGTYAVAMISVTLAGAGVTTQSFFQQTKGLHGSTLFTLSLPVSRSRLLWVRAGLGWLETVGLVCALCLCVWMIFPQVRITIAPGEMVEYVVTLVACSLGLYSIPMLLATFLDDVWRMPGSVAVFVAQWWLFNHTPLPASMNLFRAMGEGSPLITHTIPWTAMTCSLGLSGILFFAALKVVQAREY